MCVQLLNTIFPTWFELTFSVLVPLNTKYLQQLQAVTWPRTQILLVGERHTGKCSGRMWVAPQVSTQILHATFSRLNWLGLRLCDTSFHFSGIDSLEKESCQATATSWHRILVSLSRTNTSHHSMSVDNALLLYCSNITSALMKVKVWVILLLHQCKGIQLTPQQFTRGLM